MENQNSEISIIERIKKKKNANSQAIQFKCERCGKCCESLTENGKCIIPLTKKDVQTIKKLKLYKELKKEGKVLIKKGEYDYFYKHDLNAKGLCPFLNIEQKHCNIYKYRPEVCKKFICV